MEKPLFITHHKTTCSGFIGRIAIEKFGSYNRLYSPEEELPCFNKLKSPVVIFGGNMSANDNYHWLKKELLWIENLFKKNHPIFGICLGSQLMAKVLGEEIIKCPNGTIECGYLPLININEQYSNKIPQYVYQWHREGYSGKKFDSSVEILAQSKWNNNICQIFKKDSSIGVQFHPEITYERIKNLSSSTQLSQDLNHPSARPLNTHFVDHDLYGPEVLNWVTLELKPKK